MTHPKPTNTGVIFKCPVLFQSHPLYVAICTHPKNIKQPGSARSPRGLKASNTAGTQGKAVHVEGFPEKCWPAQLPTIYHQLSTEVDMRNLLGYYKYVKKAIFDPTTPFFENG